MKQHPNEHVLAIHGKNFLASFDLKSEGVYTIKEGVDLNALAADVSANMMVGNRTWLETSPDFKQVIPYMVFVKNVGTDETPDFRYMFYRRVKGTGESRLLGNGSVGFGGHVNIDDVMASLAETNIPFDPVTILQKAAHRELMEEIHFEFPEGPKSIIGNPTALLYSEADEVSTVHVGVAVINLFDGNVGIKTKEDSAELFGWKTIDEILAEENVELWTRNLLQANEVLTAANARLLGSAIAERPAMALHIERMKENEAAMLQASASVIEEVATDLNELTVASVNTFAEENDKVAANDAVVETTTVSVSDTVSTSDAALSTDTASVSNTAN